MMRMRMKMKMKMRMRMRMRIEVAVVVAVTIGVSCRFYHGESNCKDNISCILAGGFIQPGQGSHFSPLAADC
eukprot:765370-Hanusia_phi.AAC.2